MLSLSLAQFASSSSVSGRRSPPTSYPKSFIAAFTGIGFTSQNSASIKSRYNERYEQLVAAWRAQGIHVETGRFRADMQVSLVNDGPVTILMDSTKAF